MKYVCISDPEKCRHCEELCDAREPDENSRRTLNHLTYAALVALAATLTVHFISKTTSDSSSQTDQGSQTRQVEQ